MTIFSFARGAVLSAALVLGAGVAQSAPLALVETTDFDSVAPIGSTLGTLGVGVNTVSGSVDFTCIDTNGRCRVDGDGADVVRLSLAADTRLLNNSLLTFSNASVDGFLNLSFNGAFVAFTSATASGDALITNLTLPFDGPTDFFFSLSPLLNQGVSSGRQRFDYSFRLEVESLVAAVPLPASGLLLLSVLAAGAVVRRRFD